mgnify:CR=1 FL=1
MPGTYSNVFKNTLDFNFRLNCFLFTSFCSVCIFYWFFFSLKKRKRKMCTHKIDRHSVFSFHCTATLLFFFALNGWQFVKLWRLIFIYNVQNGAFCRGLCCCKSFSYFFITHSAMTFSISFIHIIWWKFPDKKINLTHFNQIC